ncbi:MAG TPA: beta-ketoacyl-[acyl-carrier-protein] synthase family protein [Cytophagaceae bacterium]|jgi:3-oxoacyl-[acyl-carrier-protein] synthase-1
MSGRVYITGMGIISAIGNNVQENYEALCNQQSGIDKLRFLQTRNSELLVAEVKKSNKELLELANPMYVRGINRTAMLGIIAASEAYDQAKLSREDKARTGLISSTTVGGMSKTEIFFKQYQDKRQEGEFLEYIESHDCGDIAERIADHLHVTDFVTTISTACSSSANAIMLGARMIKNKMLDRVIVGGADSLTKFTINGFNTLMILDKKSCKPFDENRNGLNLGEGAAYLVLESENEIARTGKKVLGELIGFGNANDAYHQTASSPEGKGAYLAMKSAITLADLNEEKIDYINVHGTGTCNNDLSEGRALERVFSGRMPYVSSTKSYTGHTLAACGSIEAIFSLLSIQHNVIFPNLNFTTQMKELNFAPVTELKTNIKINYVLSNSFGFGGNNSTLIFSR